MKRNLTMFIGGAGIGAALLCGGCNRAPKPAPNPAGVLNSDGSTTNPDGSVTYPARTAPVTAPIHNADGSITNPDGSVTYPKGSPQAQRETSAQSVGAPGPPPPTATSTRPAQPAPLTLPAETPLTVRITERLSAHDNEVGDRFTGVVDVPVTLHGEIVIPRGTPVSGEVVAAKRKGRFAGAGDLGIELTEIGHERVHTSEYEAIAKGKGKRTAGIIGGGAGLGAIIGGIAGGGKGALIGGLAGAGGGTAADAYTGNKDVVIPSESVIRFRLTEPLTR